MRVTGYGFCLSLVSVLTVAFSQRKRHLPVEPQESPQRVPGKTTVPAAINICVQIPVWVSVFSSLGYRSRSGNCGVLWLISTYALMSRIRKSIEIASRLMVSEGWEGQGSRE